MIKKYLKYLGNRFEIFEMKKVILEKLQSLQNWQLKLPAELQLGLKFHRGRFRFR